MEEGHDIEEGHGKVPRWLIITYIVLPIWGIIWLFLYWNGSAGWLDPNYWQELERAANTTYPTQNVMDQAK